MIESSLVFASFHESMNLKNERDCRDGIELIKILILMNAKDAFHQL